MDISRNNETFSKKTEKEAFFSFNNLFCLWLKQNALAVIQIVQLKTTVVKIPVTIWDIYQTAFCRADKNKEGPCLTLSQIVLPDRRFETILFVQILFLRLLTLL